jgi:hypothetical protein
VALNHPRASKCDKHPIFTHIIWNFYFLKIIYFSISNKKNRNFEIMDGLQNF